MVSHHLSWNLTCEPREFRCCNGDILKVVGRDKSHHFYSNNFLIREKPELSGSIVSSGAHNQAATFNSLCPCGCGKYLSHFHCVKLVTYLDDSMYNFWPTHPRNDNFGVDTGIPKPLLDFSDLLYFARTSYTTDLGSPKCRMIFTDKRSVRTLSIIAVFDCNPRLVSGLHYFQVRMA